MLSCMFFFSSRRRHTRSLRDWSSDVCSSDLQPRGVVLVTGPTGSGKSTTLAAMVNHKNENEEGHVLTIEDRSEERRVGKECRCRWSRQHSKKQSKTP